MDRLRVAAYLRRLQDGEEELEAAWAVFRDERVGLTQYRGSEMPPSPASLQRKLAALLERACPEIVSRTREAALVELASLYQPAVQALRESVNGDFPDAPTARARIEAARVLLGALGIPDSGSGATAAASIHVSLGDGLRAMRHVHAEVRDAGDP
jgi:hypothetical protein